MVPLFLCIFLLDVYKSSTLKRLSVILFMIDLNLHMQEESWQPVNDQNPFDIPYDSEYVEPCPHMSYNHPHSNLVISYFVYDRSENLHMQEESWQPVNDQNPFEKIHVVGENSILLKIRK